MIKHYIYKKLDGRIKMVSQGSIDFDKGIFDEAILDLPSDKEKEFEQAKIGYYINGEIVIKSPFNKSNEIANIEQEITVLQNKSNPTKDEMLNLISHVVKIIE